MQDQRGVGQVAPTSLLPSGVLVPGTRKIADCQEVGVCSDTWLKRPHATLAVGV